MPKAPRPFPEHARIHMKLNDYFALLHRYNSEIAAWRSEFNTLTGENPNHLPESVKLVRQETKL